MAALLDRATTPPFSTQYWSASPVAKIQKLLSQQHTHRGLIADAVGPALFAAAYTFEGLARPGYDPARETISALSLGPNG